ncbi:MAG: ketosteroid isomerase family protein [Cyanobacteria bacterium J06588_5]
MRVSRAIAHKTVQRYFDSLNQGQFVTTAALFAQTGQLIAPFEGATVGPGNIQTYLEKKAKNMSATPQQWSFSPRENDQWQVEVSGKVKTTVFQVNVSWLFFINDSSQLISARVKLIASPIELLNLRAVAST